MRNFKINRKGNTIRGKIYGDTSKKRSVIILSHGFMANQKSCKAYAEFLAKAGFIAVTYDFCGGGLGSVSDGKTEEMTVFTEKEDLLSVIRTFEKQPYTKDISLFGMSQGGFVSAMVAKEIPERIKKLILLFPALCIPDDARKGQMMFYRFDPENIPDILGKRPMKLGGDYARCVLKMDASIEIGGFFGPVLYVHGTADRIVDISYARKGHTLYDNCDYHEIEGAGHGFRRKENILVKAWMLDFLLREEGEDFS